MPNHDHGVGKLLKCNLVCSIHVLDHLILSIPHLAVRENLCVLIFHNLLQVAKSYDVVVIDVWIYQVVNNFGVKLSMILDRHNIPTRVCSLKFGDFPVINFFLCSTQRQRTSLVRTNKWNYRMIFFFLHSLAFLYATTCRVLGVQLYHHTVRQLENHTHYSMIHLLWPPNQWSQTISPNLPMSNQ